MASPAATSRVGERHIRVGLWNRTQTDNGHGGVTYGPYKFVRNAWAKVLKPHFWNINAQGGPASRITQGFTIRYADDIAEGWQVVYHGISHKILHIDYSNPTEMTLTCQAIVHNG